MRYMFLIYTNEKADAQMTPEEVQAAMEGHRAVMTETSQLGIFRGADPLQSTSTAKTVRMRDGKVLATDGPFAETKEQLGGYYILDCKDMEEALYWAVRIPTVCGGGAGSVEIRPLRKMEKLAEVHAEASAHSRDQA
jgi:hypothetical protein